MALWGQELVVNGDLESWKRCPDGPVMKRLKVDGKVKGVKGDPDLYAACSTSFGVPENWSGQQAAWDGEAYTGLVLTRDMPMECSSREYLQFPLSEALQNGRRYRLTFRVSTAEHSGYVTDRVAAQFSTVDHGLKGFPAALHERADVEGPLGRMLNDTSGWTTVTGLFNAKGGERSVVIGNFQRCNSSTRVRMYPSKSVGLERKNAARMDPDARRGAWREWMARTAYVYLDGVSLMPDSTSPDRIELLTPELACPEDVPRAIGPELIPDPGFERNLHPTPYSWRNASRATPDLFDGETGIHLYSDGYRDNREFIRTPLIEVLSPCMRYRLSMDVRLNPSYAFAADAIGVAVTDSFSNRYDRLRIDLPWAWRSPSFAEALPAPAEEWPKRVLLYFPSDSDLPLNVEPEALDRLVERLKADRSLSLHITGHADNSGTEPSNLRLAKTRAERLRALLLERAAPPTSIHCYSEGSNKPIADNATEEGRALNRRVVLELKSAKLEE